jgi:ATP/ADP translocase
MRKNFYSVLNIESNEKVSVVLFLIQSVFLGIFYGAFDVGAHAMFLAVYPASMIPKAYVISGLAGIILTTLYARLQSRYKFSSVAIFNLIFISVSTVLLRVLFQYTESSWLVFLIFIMMGPLNIMALLGFWGAVGRMFSLRQGKRLFGLIDSGQIFGAILSTFAIPILIAVGFEQKNLLFISSVSVMCAFFMQIVISIKFNLNIQVQTSTIKKKRLPELLKNKYIRLMSGFVVISMLVAFFVQFSFLSVTKDNYPDHNDLAEFLGAFTGTLLLFTFLFKTFLYSKLMKTYGLKMSIIISSFLIGIFTFLAALIGSLAGYTSASGGFIFFFLIISLSRLFSKVLKDAVEVPSFKILYQSLKAEIRHDVQAYVDGTINEVAALAAGLLLAVLSFFEFFKLIHFSYSTLIILGIWFLVARKLYTEYKVSLQKTLAEHKGVKDDTESISSFVGENLEKDSIINQDGLISGLEINYELSPLQFENNIGKIIDHNDEDIKQYALDKVFNSKLIEPFTKLPKKVVQKEIDEHKISEVWQSEDLKVNKSPSKERLIALSKSKGTDERILAAWLIGQFYEPELFVYLKALLRDLQLTVKIAGVKAAVNSENKEFCSIISEYLDTSGLITHAYDALLQFGESALTSIDLLFYKTGASHRVLLRIVKLIGEIGGDKAVELLIKKLDHPNEEILNQVLITLGKSKFEVKERHLIQLQQIIEKHIGVMGWNIAAKSTMDEVKSQEFLKEAIEEELKANYILLYQLLSLTYDSKSVMHVKENIESGTGEGTSYALELLELFIDEEIKPKLFPVVEDISLLEKIKQLQNFYPIEKLSFEDLLIAIINRDINFINVWTKACAINAFGENENKEIPKDLIAHIFNPNDILRETAGVVINSLNSDNYNSVSSRLDVNYKEDLDSSIELLSTSHNHLYVEKTAFLKSIEYFKNVDGRYLYELAQNLHTLKFETYDPEDIIISDIKDKILILKGAPAELFLDDIKVELVEGELYDMSEILKNSKKKISLIQNENCWIYYIEKRDLIYNMFDFFKIESSVIKWLTKKIEAEKIY